MSGIASVAKPATRFDQWFFGKQLGHDWASHNFENWAKWLKKYRYFECRVLEVGSWEGRSALFFLNYLLRSTVMCVDTWMGSEEHSAKDIIGIERRFDQNVAEFGKRVVKFVGRSSNILPVLAVEAFRFDVAYIDGSHRSVDVYSDGVLAWSMLVSGGIMIFDDYEWNQMPVPEDNPSLGINTFLTNFDGQYRLIHTGYQVALEKL